MKLLKISLALALIFFNDAISLTSVDIFKNHLNPVFIETGTYHGEGVLGALRVGFQEVHSIELSPTLFERCRNGFSHDSRVHLYWGDSSKLLKEILPRIHQRSTFWLDSHYSGGMTAMGNTHSPVLQELAIIKDHEIKDHTIIISDIHLAGTASFDYIELEEIIHAIRQINPLYVIDFVDRNASNDLLIATIPAETAVKHYPAPPVSIPDHLYNDFTLNGQIPVYNAYIDSTYSEPKVYTTQMYNESIQKALRREMNYYGVTDLYVYQALDDFADQIRGKEVGLIGSAEPWYESVLLAYGARPVVVEYNSITTPDARVKYMTPDEYLKNPIRFEFLLSISSTEHDGLGRYGDPVDPDGDLKSMDRFKEMLLPDGKLLLSVPIGKDALLWNAHRVYGPKRLKMLLNGWKPIKYYGFSYLNLLDDPFLTHQPLILLEKK